MCSSIDRRPDAPRGLHLRRVRIDEQRHPDARPRRAPVSLLDPRLLAPHIQPALGGHLLPLLRHQAAILRPHLARNADHLVGHRHLEIHAGLQETPQHPDIGVLDVAPILAQVQRDAVRARLLGEQRRVHGIRLVDAARLAQGRHMIDVHAERDAGRGAHGCSGGSTSARGGAWRRMTSRDFKLAAVEAGLERRPQHALGIPQRAASTNLSSSRSVERSAVDGARAPPPRRAARRVRAANR